MELKNFGQLTARDPRLAATMPGSRDLLAELQQQAAPHDLIELVPDQLCQRYERCRKLFVYAYFEYDFFTVAAEYALLTVEMGLRERIREKNPSRGPWLDSGNSTLSPLIDVAIADGVITREAAEQFSLKAAESDEDGNAGQSPWVASTRSPVRSLRNIAGHATETMTLTPPMSLMTISLVADIINHLWRA